MPRTVCAFTFEGAAVAKGRPRVTTRGGFARAYTPKDTVAFETAIGVEAQRAMRDGGSMVVDEPVGIRILIIRAPLKSSSKRLRAALAGRWSLASKDVDNQAKAILDGLNGVVYMDDRQVADLHITRRWGDADKIHITVTTEPEAVS